MFADKYILNFTDYVQHIGNNKTTMKFRPV